MSKEFLGKGWGFPVKIDRTSGSIAAAEYDEDIRQSIWIILSTAKGERVMRPDFGCGIHELVFSILNTTTLTLTESAVREALTQWEQRIDLNDVKATVNYDDAGKLEINIDYTVRSTNSRYNLVYPFYLNE